MSNAARDAASLAYICASNVSNARAGLAGIEAATTHVPATASTVAIRFISHLNFSIDF